MAERVPQRKTMIWTTPTESITACSKTSKMVQQPKISPTMLTITPVPAAAKQWRKWLQGFKNSMKTLQTTSPMA
jgi:hypothetical protein